MDISKLNEVIYKSGGFPITRNELIKAVWIKAKQLGLYDSSQSKEEIKKESELYQLIYRETKKENMSNCTNEELQKVLQVLKLFIMQNEIKKGRATEKQLSYIKSLENKLGWSGNSKRLKGFIKKYTNVESMNWLTPRQASNVIEALKKILEKNNN